MLLPVGNSIRHRVFAGRQPCCVKSCCVAISVNLSTGGIPGVSQNIAIGVYCALRAEDFAHGVLLAVNHGGDADSTGSIAGNLLGLIHGEEGIPGQWLERLELRDVIARVADDLWVHFGAGEKPAGEAGGAVQGADERADDRGSQVSLTARTIASSGS